MWVVLVQSTSVDPWRGRKVALRVRERRRGRRRRRRGIGKKKTKVLQTREEKEERGEMVATTVYMVNKEQCGPTVVIDIDEVRRSVVSRLTRKGENLFQTRKK